MHKPALIINYFVGILLSVLLLSCNAYRDNPLDPSSPNNIYISIQGKVKTESLPREPIPVAEVFWRGSNITVNTDNTGSFSIRDVNRKNDWIIFSKDGYASDSVYVEWNENKFVNVEAFLNADPVLDSLIVSSKVINELPAEQTSYCEIYARFSDAENDIDSVFVNNPELNFTSVLYYNPSSKFFYNSFSEAELGVFAFDEIIGTEFHILAEDSKGKLFDIGDKQVKRVIKEEIIFETPKNNNETNNPVVLSWNSFQPGFSFTYNIEIYSIDLPPVLIWHHEGIPEAEINYTVTAQLPSGQYYWVIWGIDEHYNKTRSKPASFTVR